MRVLPCFFQFLGTSPIPWLAITDRLGLGTLLQCLYLDTPFLEQQNAKKHYGAKNNCMHAQFSSVHSLSYVQLCDPMNCSMPGLPVHHQLPEFTQTHVHRVGDAIQPSHPLSSPSPPAPSRSQHQSLFQ